MIKISKLTVPGYEKVIEAIDEESGLHCFIALHDSTLGPGLGGTRIFPYPDREAALDDCLRLAEGMTNKSAVAQVGTGGAKAVIIGDSHGKKSFEMLKAYSEVVNSFEGTFITAEDVGTTTDDMAVMREFTPYLVGLPLELGAGDPSPYTAWGVFKGIEAAAMALYGTADLEGKRIAIQGLGKVGSVLANLLFWHGAKLIVADPYQKRAQEIAQLYEAELVSPSEIHKVPCDIFAPCALGAIINDYTVDEFQCKAIAGAANNQLHKKEHAEVLKNKGILYAPDYVINAGGLIQVTKEIDPEGYSATKARLATNQIYDTLIHIFEKAKLEDKSTEKVAVELAKHNLLHHIGRRKIPFTANHSKGYFIRKKTPHGQNH